MEWDGSQISAHEVFLNPDGSQTGDITIRMSDGEKTIVATDITLTNLNREFPADDKTSGTLDFKADNFRREGPG